MMADETCETVDGDSPVLADEVGRHLARILIAVYELECPVATTADRFAGLLSKLRVALDAADDRKTEEFRDALMATAPVLRRYAISLTHDQTSAEDLVQDTLLRAWRSQASFTLGTKLEAWVFTIMRNQFYSDRRKRGREVQDSEGTYAEKLIDLPAQTGYVDLLDVRAALDRLPPVMREALVLVAVQRLSYEEAAAVMGCEIGTAKSRVWRARDQLIKSLGDFAAGVEQDPVTLSVISSSLR